METTELFYPEINASIGSYEFQSGISIEVQSSKKSYYDWAKIKFTEELQERVILDRKEEARLELGYNEILEKVFEGYVTSSFSNEKKENEILLKDKMIFLEETFLSSTFLDTTPQEMISYCLSKAGITEFELSMECYPIKKVVVVDKKNILAILHQVHLIWGIKTEFFFSNGIFYWGVKPEQEKIYRFEYGVNIISLGKANGRWELETVAAPFIKHSNLIEIVHPKVTGEFEVEKVVFTTSENGFLRTVIYF